MARRREPAGQGHHTPGPSRRVTMFRLTTWCQLRFHLSFSFSQRSGRAQPALFNFGTAFRRSGRSFRPLL